MLFPNILEKKRSVNIICVSKNLQITEETTQNNKRCSHALYRRGTSLFVWWAFGDALETDKFSFHALHL